MGGNIIALFAKAPIPGQVKTRLCPPLSFSEAASLYQAMLTDILEQHAACSGADRVLWYTPATAAGWFQHAARVGYELCAQQGADLGARMSHVFRVHAAQGYERIVLRGTDSPTLPLVRIASAFEALERVELVLCPDRDGGYNLIGLREPCDALFEMELSTETVLERTLACARERGLGVEILPPHYDVDTAADLATLQKELSEDFTPHTMQWFHGTKVRLGP